MEIILYSLHRSILPNFLTSMPVMGDLGVVRREGEIQVGDPVYVTRGVINQPGDIEDY